MWEQNAKFVYCLLGQEYKKFQQSSEQQPREHLMELATISTEIVVLACNIRVAEKAGDYERVAQFGQAIEVLAEQAENAYNMGQKEQG